jgi:hypothetical protein
MNIIDEALYWHNAFVIASITAFAAFAIYCLTKNEEPWP